MKKLRSNLYTKEKIVLRDHRHRYIEDKDGYLFAQGIYPTKIKAEDLPDWYVYGRYYKCFGYLSAKCVVDVRYEPNRYSNHFLKDDFLFISYHASIAEQSEASNVFEKYSGYDERISGNALLRFLKAAREYSDYDISEIAQMIQDKADWLRQIFPEEYGDFEFDGGFLEESPEEWTHSL